MTTMSRQLKWDHRFMDMAELVAQWSKDPSTKVGAVITSEHYVLAVGYNGFPRGCDDSPEMYADRSIKYPRVVHAEMNALIALRQPLRLLPSPTLYVTMFSCADCAGPVINAGVKRVVYLKEASVDRWSDSHDHAFVMYEEADVDTFALDAV